MGTVTEFVWSNPHCQIYLDAKDQKGNAAKWAVESQSPGILRRNGWDKDSIMPGDRISITLAPARNGGIQDTIAQGLELQRAPASGP